MPAYKEPYNYPYGKYLMIKKFSIVNEEVLEKLKKIIDDLELQGKNNEKYLLPKKGSTADSAGTQRSVEKIIQTVLGNIFEGYEGLKDSYEAEYCTDYLRLQYYLTAVALRFFSNLSPIEAAFEAGFLVKYLFRTKGAPLHMLIPIKTKADFLTVYILSNDCLNIYLAVKYLEQLGLSKNPAKDKKLVTQIQKGMRKLEEDLKKRKLTREEWESREKTRSEFRARI